MSLASILYIDGRLKQVDVDKALAAYNALTGVTEPTEAQADWLCSIRRIFLPPSQRPDGYDPAYGFTKLPEVQTQLTHEGIDQGMNEAIPRGDR